MTPTEYGLMKEDFTVKTYPSKTYDLKYDSERISGKTDKLEAVKQAIYKILCTDRYRHIIYSYNYGVELSGLIGKSYGYVCSVIRQRVTEALMQDDRITDVYNFGFERNRKARSLLVTFNVDTTEGTVKAQKEVSLDV